MESLRRIALPCLLVLCLAAAAAELSDAEWAALKKKALERPRNIYYNDGDDVNYNHGEPTIEGILAKRTTWLPKYPINTLIYCVNGSSFQMKVPTKNGELADFEWPDTYRSVATYGNVNVVTWLVKHGHDIIKLQQDFAHAHGMDFFAEFRFNDTHDYWDNPQEPCPFYPRFKREHPEYIMGSYENQPPYAYWSSYDFTHKEIRDKFVALIAEVADKYELDGILIDFFRWLGIFKSVAWGGTASPEEVEMLSDMFRQIRAATEVAGRRRGRPILLAVRCADSPEYCLASGFDWEGLMAEGVFDMVFPAGNDHFEPWGNSIALCHKYGVKCYPSIDMPSFDGQPLILARKVNEAYWAREAAAYQAGADGIYYYNMFNENVVANMPATYGDLQLKNKRYFISPLAFNCWITIERTLAGGDRLCQLPQLFPGRPSTFQPGDTKTFRLEFGDDLAALQRAGVPVRTWATLVADGDARQLEVTSNGVAWHYCGKYQNKYAYEVPPEALRPGLNELHFASKAAASDEPIWHEILTGDVILSGSRQPPWRRLFYMAADNRDNETIVDGAYRIRDTGKGSPNLVYPLDNGASRNGIDATFEACVENSNDPLGAMIRVAAAGKVEIVTLQTDKVGFHFAGKTVPFDTTKFHQYHVRLTADTITLEADGKALLEAAAVMSSDDPKGRLTGMGEIVHGLHDSCLAIGSLADEGHGTSRWRHLKLRRSRNAVVLHDCVVDVMLDGAYTPKADVEWQQTANNVTTLSAGNYAYYPYPIVAECDLELPADGSAQLYLSSGGLITTVCVLGSGLIADEGRVVPMPPAKDAVRKIRLEMDNQTARVFVDGTFCTTTGVAIVTGVLKSDPAMVKLNEESKGIVRNSGLIVKPAGAAKVQALRVREYPTK